MITNYCTIFGVNRLRKVYTISFACLLVLTFYELFWKPIDEVKYIYSNKESAINFGSYEQKRRILNADVNAYFEKRKHWATSNLGSVLFKNNVQHYYSTRNKTFVILIWRYWGWLKTRFLGHHEGNDPFSECSVRNCIVTGDDTVISSADAVVIHVQHGILPSPRGRRVYQRWVFLSDESPVNTFSMAGKKPNLSRWANVFNWSMTYRSDSDVPVPYGRTVPLTTSGMPIDTSESIKDLIPFWERKERKVLVAALISHCRVPERMNYIKELQKYIEVDVYGKCSEKNLTCPGHFRADCPVLNKYLFYLAFENTKCRQYLTEKIFYNAYSKGAIPIIMGAPREDCEHLLPPYSFLHVDNYKNPKGLAEDLQRIMKSEETLLMYHQWRRHYELLNEHGYFESKAYHLCRLCEALNYNDESPKWYGEDDLKLFFEPKLICNLPDRH